MSAYKLGRAKWEKRYIRFILTYHLGKPGRTSRRVMFKKASYLDGNTICKPFRKK